MAQLLVSGLPEGDTPTFPVDTDEPPAVAAAPAPAAGTPAPSAETPAPPAPTPAPVILAKDGVHTIPYEKLEEARLAAQAAKDAEQAALARAATLAAEVEALKAKTPAPAPTAAPTAPEADADLFGDYSEAAMAQGVSKLVAAAVAPLVAQVESLKGKLGEADKQAEVDAATAHWSALYKAHPDLDSLAESAELDTWVKGQPSFLQPALRQTLEQGSTAQVIELFNTFKAATGKTTPPAPVSPGATAEAEAAAAIAAAKAKPPTSLSEIPAGSQAHVDPTAALLQATPQQLMTRFASMTPEQIEALVSRAL